MALTQITKAGAGVARITAFNQQSIQNISNKIAKAQQLKNAEAAAVVKRGQAYTDDFYAMYGKQTRSGNEAWNAGAGEFVGKLAAEQEEMYSLAHGPNGTPELRNAWRLRQIRDRGILSNIGSWAAISNNNASAMQENQSAYAQNIDLGRMTRGNNLSKYSFAQNMQNDQYSNYNFGLDDSGNVILNAQNVDANGQVVNSSSRNLSADVADNKAGNEWYSQIKEKDLLKNKLNKNWTDKNNGYNTLFKKRVEVNKVYSDKDGWKTTTTEKYDPDEVKTSLLSNYSNRLDAEVLGPGFDKTWDQLWRNGYLKNNDGEDLMGSEISWSEFKKIKSMDSQTFINKYGDPDNDPTTDAEADKQYLQDKMMSTAREGLANYYSGNMVPAEDQITRVTTEPGGKGSGYSEKDKLEFQAESRYYNNFVTDSPGIIKANPINAKSSDEAKQKRSIAVVKEMNSNIPTKAGDMEFMTGDQAEAALISNKQEAESIDFSPSAIYKVIKTKTANRKKGEPLFTYQFTRVIREEQALTGNKEDLTFYMASGVEITDEAQNYLKTELP
jgi:hypothetical protein